MHPRDLRAIACDYDRTLTGPDLEPVPEALEALAQARKAGRKVLVVSGRDAAFLEREVAAYADAVVAENGCLVQGPGGPRRPVKTAWPNLRDVFADAPFEVEHGEVIASVDLAHEELVLETLRLADVHAQAEIIRNRDRIMILPRGVDKAAGLLAALHMLDLEPSLVAAAGDGENDLVMLREVGYGIAVQNAVPELKEVAHHVTERPGGWGVAEWIREHWLDGRTAP